MKDKPVYYDTVKKQMYWIEWEDTGNSEIPHRHYLPQLEHKEKETQKSEVQVGDLKSLVVSWLKDMYAGGGMPSSKKFDYEVNDIIHEINSYFDGSFDKWKQRQMLFFNKVKT